MRLKLATLLIACFILTTIANGQDIELELFGGVSWGQFRGSPEFEDNYQRQNQKSFGYTFGVSVQKDASDHFTFWTAILRERKGSNVGTFYYYSGFNTTAVTDITLLSEDYRMNSYSVSSVPCYKFGDDKLEVQIGVGTYLGYVQEQIVETYGPYLEHETLDQSSLNQSFEFGFSFRTSLRASVTDELNISLTALNQLGLTDLRKVSNETLKTNAFSIMLGVGWRIGENAAHP